ncbi:MAG: DNA polymerase III subunit delta [Balneolaceae bacterium]
MAKKTSIEFYREALQSIRNPNHRKPVYFFYGDETFFLDLLQDEAIRQIQPDQQDFNLDLLYGSEVSPNKVLDIARSYPMMADLRVVVVRDFAKLGGRAEEEGHVNDFIPYLENPNPTTFLCLIDTKSPDKRTNLGKALTNSTNVYSREFNKLPDYKLPDWAADWVRHKHKKEMDPEAAQILTQLAGDNLQILATEIEKVCTYVDEESRINRDHVIKIIGSYREFSVIELKEAVISRDLEKSVKIAEKMLLAANSENGEIIRTVGFFYSVFGNIWQICRLKERGMAKSKIQQEMGIKNNWFFNKLWEDASGFSLAEMPAVYEALLDTDRSAKGFSTLDSTTILFLLIKRLLGTENYYRKHGEE